MCSQEVDTNCVPAWEPKHSTLNKGVKELRNFKISGYIQAQYQYGEPDALLKVGTKNENPERPYHRVGVRRGRIKLMYSDPIIGSVLQLDLTERGIGLKDAFLTVRDPWFNSASLIKAGVFDRLFGNEISYSSSLRESPERTLLCQTLFPEERDVGIMLALQAPAASAWHIVKLEMGGFAGNGIKMETDSRMDFIAHLSASKTFDSNIKLGGGVSYYFGSVYQGTEKVYAMQGEDFKLSQANENRGKFAKREYIGLDLQFSVAGISHLRAEYLFGQQPGSFADGKSPNASVLPAHDTYVRKFSGAYIILIQDFVLLPLSVVLKYDWYDPNRKMAGSSIGLRPHSGAGDIACYTFGFGLLWRVMPNVRLQAYYEFIENETSANLAGYNRDKKDNVFTLRVQCKF
ncbi:MAG: hypothetical protein LBK03_03325 [Bacteroidales bacterium]|nr:hypothetical protein [Bacteroidales bacterium]